MIIFVEYCIFKNIIKNCSTTPERIELKFLFNNREKEWLHSFYEE
jgi:hypothetical protein